MNSGDGEFWDERYQAEGLIWGEDPSPTARVAAMQIAPESCVLEVGFGYGRDLAFYLQSGYQVHGIEMSRTGHRLSRERLRDEPVQPVSLIHGNFETVHFEEEPFDAIVSHRLAHLLIDDSRLQAHVNRLNEALVPQGLLCLSARNDQDLDRTAMIEVGDQVYEYSSRPGHRIRYWSDELFERVFGESFSILSLFRTEEQESRKRPVPCYLTIMVARKRDRSLGASGQ